MTPSELRESAARGERLPGLTPALEALWLDACGEWDAAHERVQEEGSADAAWVHAYLHRKEGEVANAGYWYRRVGRPVCESTLEEEWERIVSELAPE